MIQLASESTAGRPSFHPAPGEEGKGQALAAPRSRSGHAWPFLSRYAQRPAPQDSAKTTNPSGS